MARFLAKTPYVLLLSVTGINVVSAAGLVGEAGPIEHYASARAINGRAGLFPARYQSDGVDYQSSVARTCNRRLRAAAMMMAENLIKCHPYYRGLAALWTTRKVDPRDRRGYRPKVGRDCQSTGKLFSVSVHLPIPFDT